MLSDRPAHIGPGGLLVGLGMTGAGLGAAAITLGPVLLWYDRDYLGLTLHDLHAANHHLA